MQSLWVICLVMVVIISSGYLILAHQRGDVQILALHLSVYCAGPYVVMWTLILVERLYLKHRRLQQLIIASQVSRRFAVSQCGNRTQVIEYIVTVADVGSAATVLFALRSFSSVPLHYEVIGRPASLVLHEIVGEHLHIFLVQEDSIHAIAGPDCQPVGVVAGGLAQHVMNNFKAMRTQSHVVFRKQVVSRLAHANVHHLHNVSSLLADEVTRPVGRAPVLGSRGGVCIRFGVVVKLEIYGLGKVWVAEFPLGLLVPLVLQRVRLDVHHDHNHAAVHQIGGVIGQLGGDGSQCGDQIIFAISTGYGGDAY
jgi:hypothetical protein